MIGASLSELSQALGRTRSWMLGLAEADAECEALLARGLHFVRWRRAEGDVVERIGGAAAERPPHDARTSLVLPS